jgi:hypothetical protein
VAHAADDVTAVGGGGEDVVREQRIRRFGIAGKQMVGMTSDSARCSARCSCEARAASKAAWLAM